MPAASPAVAVRRSKERLRLRYHFVRFRSTSLIPKETRNLPLTGLAHLLSVSHASTLLPCASVQAFRSARVIRRVRGAAFVCTRSAFAVTALELHAGVTGVDVHDFREPPNSRRSIRRGLRDSLLENAGSERHHMPRSHVRHLRSS